MTAERVREMPYIKPSQVRQMAPDERAWVGAMIEAEGSVMVNPSHSNHKAKIMVANTDPEILSALLRATGVGHVGLKTESRQWQRKPCYTWQVQAQLEARDIALQCAPYSMKLQRVEV